MYIYRLPFNSYSILLYSILHIEKIEIEIEIEREKKNLLFLFCFLRFLFGELRAET